MNQETLEGIFHWKNSPLWSLQSLPWAESRVQRLSSRGDLWLKREDELSFSLSGPKFRKLAAIAADLEQKRPKITKIVSYGSARSQFLLGLVQLASICGLGIELNLIKSRSWEDQGTDSIYRTLLGGAHPKWFERKDFYLKMAEIKNSLPPECYWIKEGGAGAVGLKGALTLAWDIARQTALLSEPWQHIWIDAGSGLSAQAVILGLGMLGLSLKVHVVLCAGDEESFVRDLMDGRDMLREQWPEANWQCAAYSCYYPPSAAAYGAQSQALWSEIFAVLRDEQVLLDPLYNAKLFMAQNVYGSRLKGPQLLIHSGGSMSFFAFPHHHLRFES